MLPKIASLFILILAFFVKINAQSTPLASGGNASSSNGSVSYSVGEIVYTSFSTSSGIVIQGVQQAYTSLDLPVVLIAFNASLQNNNSVLINWTTVSETNNNYFIVEVSTDGKLFNKLGKIDAKGSNSAGETYQIVDQNPSNINYYRLVQVDNDGKTSYSEVIKISLPNKDFTTVNAYPNPTTSLLNLQFKSLPSTNLYYTLLTLDGKTIKNEKISNISTAIKTSTITNGQYLLQVIDGNKVIKTFKIIKN